MTEEKPKPGEIVPEERIYTASQWLLMWWRFRRHKLALVSAAVLSMAYLAALLAEFVAPHDPNRYNPRWVLAPPMKVHWVDKEGRFHLRPFVYGLQSKRDMETLAMVVLPDESRIYPLKLFARGDPYELWGRFPANRHLIGIESEDDQMLFLLGADEMGRDLLSRLIHGARISLSIGLMGVAFSVALGIVLGGISGYYGGVADTVIQRVIELLRCLPAIPLWLVELIYR